MSARGKSVRRTGAPIPDLGRLDLCLRVKDLAHSVAFYTKLGFGKVEGEAPEGWSVLERDGVRIGLFHGHIKKNTLNFRGANIRQLAEALEARGLHPTNVKFVGEGGAGNAWLEDPDGNLLFFDSTPDEVRKRSAARKRGRAGPRRRA